MISYDIIQYHIRGLEQRHESQMHPRPVFESSRFRFSSRPWGFEFLHAYFSWDKCWFTMDLPCIWIWDLRPSIWNFANRNYHTSVKTHSTRHEPGRGPKQEADTGGQALSSPELSGSPAVSERKLITRGPLNRGPPRVPARVGSRARARLQGAPGATSEPGGAANGFAVRRTFTIVMMMKLIVVLIVVIMIMILIIVNIVILIVINIIIVIMIMIIMIMILVLALKKVMWRDVVSLSADSVCLWVRFIQDLPKGWTPTRYRQLPRKLDPKGLSMEASERDKWGQHYWGHCKCHVFFDGFVGYSC